MGGCDAVAVEFYCVVCDTNAGGTFFPWWRLFLLRIYQYYLVSASPPYKGSSMCKPVNTSSGVCTLSYYPRRVVCRSRCVNPPIPSTPYAIYRSQLTLTSLPYQDMDVLFGVVSVESRRRDRLVVQNNLMGSVYDDGTQGYHSVYPMEGKSMVLNPNSQTSVHHSITPPSTADSMTRGDDLEVEAHSIEKYRSTWTIPE